MAKSIHIKPKSKLRKDKQADIKITGAAYLRGYKILVLFSNNRMKVVDFSAAIDKYAKGDYAKYAAKSQFKKFHLEDGNLVWGKDWDLIFPVADIFSSNF